MGKPIRVLVIEDSEEDALLVMRRLKEEGYCPTSERVDNAEAMQAALKDRMWDVVIADYSLPMFSALAALKLLQKSGLDLPFIVVSGTIGEDVAIAAMRSGAHDCIMKDNLKRLVPAIEREIGEARQRRKQKQAEEELEESRRQYELILNSAGEGILGLDLQGRHTFVNPAAARMLGYSAKELIGQPSHSIWHHSGADASPYPEEEYLIQAVLRDGAICRVTGGVFWRKDGTSLTVDYVSTPVKERGRVVGAVVIFNDITKRKQAEESLRESEERYRTLFESAAEGILIADVETKKLQYANPAFCTMLGYSQEELTKMSVSDIHPTASLEQVLADFAAQARGEKVLSSALPCLKKDGTIVYADIKAAKAIIDGRECNVGFFTDVTERKQAEQALLESEEKLRLMFESVTDGIVVIDLNTVITEVNARTTEMLGYTSKGDLWGKNALELLFRHDHEKASDNLGKTLEQGATKNIEYTLVKADGSEFPGEINTSVLKDASGNPVGFIAIIRDVTERKRMEEQLIVADRLASIGELASGIAHELNNPLTSVIGFAQLLLNKDFPDDIKEDVNIIYREAQRTAAVIKNLLTFARKHTSVKQPMNVNTAIEKVLELRAYEQKIHNIQVNAQLAPDLPEVTADYFQLQQVVLNIIINAEYFMIEAHSRGTLTIKTEKAGNIVTASFADDGPGISKENLGHVFDPFFTTKEVGKGTGLGLSICHGIVIEHGGRIYAESEFGKGTTFIVELPIGED